MKPAERQQVILARMRAEPREWRVDDLAAVMGVSALTVRRDLDRLAREGAILRTHGGCMLAGRMAQESSYQRRVAHQFDLKKAIGAAAAEEVGPGAVILINDGSTCFHLAANLGRCQNVTVYTNSIAMISELQRFPNIRLFVLGGEYDRQMFFLGGSLLERTLEMVDFDAVFLGADAIDPAGRCLTQDADVARTTQIMLRRGRRRILLADHTKVGAPGSVCYGTLRDFDLWILTCGLAPARRRKFQQMTTLKEVRP